MSERYPKLPNTAKALQESSVLNRRPFGSHFSPRIELTKTGRMVYEEPYDPIKHLGHIPNYLSFQAELTGQEYVTYRQPRRPTEIDIILHADPIDRRGLPWMTKAKDNLQSTLAGSLKSLHTGFDDRIYTHAIGDTSRMDREWLKDAHVIDTQNNELAASEIAKICRNGLTFIISSFHNLNFEKSNLNTGQAIGIKTNHIFEIQHQADGAVYATGEAENPYIHTKDAKQLRGWNEIIQSRNNEKIARLGNAGLVVAQVVYEGRGVDPTYGFSVTAADSVIAQATREARG